jgi:hypothetical protein
VDQEGDPHAGIVIDRGYRGAPMATPPDTREASELDSLRARIAALEDELAERSARANAAVAAAEDRAYWLDRWRVDLNRLMSHPAAGRARAALRGLRLVYRKAREVRQELPAVTAQEREAGAALGGGGQALAGSDFARAAPEQLATSDVTDLLYARLPDGAVDEVTARLDAADRAKWEAAPPADRRRLALHFGVHYGVDQVIEASGLTQAMPPEGVHAMAHGSGAAGGSIYYVCSSGRVVRVLAAAYPDVDWHGADPIPEAIDWAKDNLPGIAFEHGPERPPLPYSDAQFDVVFAISIWSHFAAPAGLAWLEEMRRIVRPGGMLLLTSAGWQTLAHDFELGLRSAEQLSEAAGAMYRDGFWFRNEFGESGDFGIVNPDWGTAFMTPDWLLARVTPQWRVAQYGPGRVEAAQDLFVLERR